MIDRTLIIAMGENACIETEMILEEAIETGEKRMAWYRERGEGGSTAAQSCMERIVQAGLARACLEHARMKGRGPAWAEDQRQTEGGQETSP